MRAVFLLWLLLAMHYHAYPQVNTNYQEHSDYLDIYDNSGRKLEVNGHSNLSGSPALNANWGTGSVVFTTGRQISGLPLQFNVRDNRLCFKKDSTVYTFTDKVLAFKMTYPENNQPREVIFRSGYPNHKGDSTSFLYQVINDGPNVHFLKRLASIITQQYVYGSAAKESYTVTSESFLYIVKHNLLVKIVNNKKSVLKALPDYREQVEMFTGDNNLSFTTDKEINELITYLNQVQQSQDSP